MLSEWWVDEREQEIQTSTHLINIHRFAVGFVNAAIAAVVV